MKESGVHAVKLEGGVRVAEHIARISGAGIPVMGHIGFTPQSEHGLGGHVVQGRGDDAAKLISDGKAVEAAGAFAVVVEMVPKAVATQLASELTIPVIGIGAGNGVDGQILVWTDLAGMSTGRIPSFVKQYASLHETLRTAVTNWQNDVRSRAFPDDAHSFVD
jgi:3-methyl-2-oxobutanoate hydroxymethyltransferase